MSGATTAVAAESAGHRTGSTTTRGKIKGQLATTWPGAPLSASERGVGGRGPARPAGERRPLSPAPHPEAGRRSPSGRQPEFDGELLRPLVRRRGLLQDRVHQVVEQLAQLGRLDLVGDRLGPGPVLLDQLRRPWRTRSPSGTGRGPARPCRPRPCRPATCARAPPDQPEQFALRRPADSPSRARASSSVGRAASTSCPASSLLSSSPSQSLRSLRIWKATPEVPAELGRPPSRTSRPGRPAGRRSTAPPRTRGRSSGRRSSARRAGSAPCPRRPARAVRPPAPRTASGGRRPACRGCRRRTSPPSSLRSRLTSR